MSTLSRLVFVQGINSEFQAESKYIFCESAPKL